MISRKFQILTFLLLASLELDSAFCAELDIHNSKKSSFEVSPSIENKSQEPDFSKGIDAPLPSQMYDANIAKPTKHFVLIRGWEDKKKKSDQLPPELAPRANQEEVKKGQEHLAEPVKSPREEIIARFGDPKKPPVVIPEEKAPAPFKGLHAALEAGDEELAFQYARQHVKYTGKFQDRVSNIVGLTAKALEVEGLADGEGWTNAEEYNKYEKYVKEAFDEQRKERERYTEDRYMAALPEDLKALAQKLLIESPTNEQQLDEFNREKLSSYLKSVVSPVSDGIVKLTLFVNPDGDRSSLLMARELSRLAEQLSGQKRVTLSLASTSYIHPDQKRSFMIRSGISSNLEYIEADLPEGAIGVPALVIETPATGEKVVMNGNRRATFVEEIVKLLHGGELW